MKKLMLIMIMLVMVGCNKKPVHSEYDERIKNKTEARDAAEEIVKYKAKLPTTVEFERRYGVNIAVNDAKQNEDGVDEYTVSGHFTCENSFGGKVRHWYMITMVKGSFRWEPKGEPIISTDN